MFDLVLGVDFAIASEARSADGGENFRRGKEHYQGNLLLHPRVVLGDGL